MMIDRDEFLKSYNIEQEDFEAADMPWEELAAIYEDYQACLLYTSSIRLGKGLTTS